MQKTIKLIIVGIFIIILGVFYLSLNKNSNYDTRNLVGKKLSEIYIESFYEDKYLTNEILKKNNFLLINFWASWCSPCRTEHPILMKLNREKNLSIIGVNFKDKKNNANLFLKNLGNPYDFLAKDELGKHSINFGIYGIPESILINNDLLILKKFVGPLSTADYEEIKSIIIKK